MRTVPATIVLTLPLLLFPAIYAPAGEPSEVRGRVVDDQGRPVAGATVADFWRANGSGKGPDGDVLDLKLERNVREFWGHLGEMEPSGSPPKVATTDGEGRFVVAVGPSRHALMAMDRDRRLGALHLLAKGREQDFAEIRLGPLVKVRGLLRGPEPGRFPGWTHVYVQLPEDRARPLDSTRLVSCGSFEARFEVSLPPGRYVLAGYNEPQDAELVPDARVEVPAGQADLDLGVLNLSDARSKERLRIERAKADGSWIGVDDRYGRPAPPWFLTDARGLPSDAKLADLKGKWVLIYFWSFHCAPCLGTGLPSLMTFHERHAAERDRFQVVAFCIDGEGVLRTMADVDRKLRPIVEHVWNGKEPSFPVVLDASYRTLESFGIATLGPQLISPEGILMKGDEQVLAAKLREQTARRVQASGQP